MSRPRRVIAAVLLVFALALSTAAPASAFTVEQAQAFFLAQVCAPNAAIDQLNNAVFRGNQAFRPRKMHGKRLRQTRRALVRLARIERAVGLRLIDPPSSWPSPESAAATDALGRALVIDARILNKLRAQGRCPLRQVLEQRDAAAQRCHLARPRGGRPVTHSASRPTPPAE